MLTLYYLPSCPFCQRVLQVTENLGISLELRDISDNKTFASELLEKGGKTQVPYLVDAERGVAMYESSDIIDYLREHHAGGSVGNNTGKPRIHVGSATCESCEG